MGGLDRLEMHVVYDWAKLARAQEKAEQEHQAQLAREQAKAASLALKERIERLFEPQPMSQRSL